MLNAQLTLHPPAPALFAGVSRSEGRLPSDFGEIMVAPVCPVLLRVSEEDFPTAEPGDHPHMWVVVETVVGVSGHRLGCRYKVVLRLFVFKTFRWIRLLNLVPSHQLQ